MKLDSLYIQNFRALRDVTMTPEKKSMVLFGINGAGKSTILRAINLAYTKILNAVVDALDYAQKLDFVQDDISYGEKYSSIELTTDIDGDELPFRVVYDGMAVPDSTLLKNIVLYYHGTYSNDIDGNLPIYIYYGINRNIDEVPVEAQQSQDPDRFRTYEHAIQSRAEFTGFFEWFREQEDSENSEKVERDDLSYKDKSLTAVRQAIETALDGCRHIRVERKPRLAMTVEKNGEKTYVSQMSDGEKDMLAVFGDIARRLSIANPNLDNPLEGEGMVLIDEVELHLHPSWQRQILKKLRKVFPNVQFIVTTHSPMVLSEISEDYCLYSISSADDNSSVVEQVRSLDGFDVNRILGSYMDTPDQSDRSAELRRKLGKAVMSHDRKAIEKHLKALEKLSDENDIDVMRAKRSLLRMKKNEVH